MLKLEGNTWGRLCCRVGTLFGVGKEKNTNHRGDSADFETTPHVSKKHCQVDISAQMIRVVKRPDHDPGSWLENQV